jgi:phosphoglycerate dehydrogenase-like enzyme
MRVAVLDDYQRVALAMADWGPVAARARIDVSDRVLTGPALTGFLSGATVVAVMRERTRIDAALMDALPDLRLIATSGLGNAAIDMAAARARGITVCGTPGSGTATAELAFGLILSLARSIPQEAEALRAGDPRSQQGVGWEVAGRTLGVVGFGRLGKRVAAMGLAFGMRVLAHSRSLTEAQARAAGVEAVPLDALLAGADVVSVHLPLTPATRGLIGAAALGRMKPGAVLVNTARGPIVDEAALVAALETRAIRGAALDVFDAEPLPQGHPFRSLPNVIATPHLGYVTEETYRVFYGGIVEAIAAWMDGAPVRVLNA